MIDIEKRHLEVLLSILQRRIPGKDVRAFGSRAKGRARPASDLDLVIIDSSPLPRESLLLLLGDFAESDLPFSVDVVEWTRLTDAFRSLIRSHWQAIFPVPLEGSAPLAGPDHGGSPDDFPRAK